MSNSARFALLGAALVVAVAAFFIARPGDDESDAPVTNATTTAQLTQTGATATTTTPTVPPEPPIRVVKVSGGEPVGELAKLSFKRGELVRFVVQSATEDNIHIHGYDIDHDVAEGGRITFAFRADKDGIYEVEAHSSGAQVAELRIDP